MQGSKKEIIYTLILISLGLAFFYKAFSFGFFNIDDHIHTTENIAVKSFDLRGILTKYYIGLYHPLTSLSFAIDWWLGGSKPWMFHLSNFIFHLLATLVLFKISLKLWPKRIVLGFFIGLAFLLHPLKTESVVWITERKDVLSGLFLWLTIYFYLIYLDHHKPRYYIFAIMAFFFALASKVSVVTLAPFLLVVDWYRNKRVNFKSLINKAPFFLMALTTGLLHVLEQSRARSSWNIPEKNYFDLVYQVQFYLEKFIFPFDLRWWYSPEHLKFNTLSISAIALMSLLAILAIRKSTAHRRDFIFGLLTFLLFLFPNAKILPRGDANLVNDRYMYIALTGLTFAFFPFILQSIEDLWRNQKRFVSYALSLVFMAFILQWLYLMHLQVPYWKDSLTLWERTVKFEPNTRIVAGHYGKALLGAGRYAEAVPYLQNSQGLAEDYENLGYVLNKINKPQEAESAILEALKIYPGNSGLLNMLGIFKLGKGENQEALALFGEAMNNLNKEYSPRLRAMILNHTGLSNMELGNYGAAESFFRQSLDLYNRDEKATYNLGTSLLKQNRLQEAKVAFLDALKLDPSRSETYNKIGFIFYHEKNFIEAHSWFKRSLELDPNNKVVKNNLITMEREGH